MLKVGDDRANNAIEPTDLAAAARGLFDASPDLVGIVEREEPHRVLYLNPAAQKYAAGPIASVLGHPLREAFKRATSGPLLAVVERAAHGEPQALRGVRTRPGSEWNIDARPQGPVILLAGRPLDAGGATKQRIEMLLASTDAIWQNADADSLAGAIVRAAAALLPGTACGLSMLRRVGDQELTIVATSEDSLCVGTTIPFAASHSGRAIVEQRPVEGVTGGSDASHREALMAAGVRHMRVVPLLPSAPLPDGRTVLGVLNFMSTHDEPFDEDERRLMDEFGKRASVALDRAELVKAERLKAERHKVAFDAAMALSSSLSPQDVIHELLQRVVTLLDADRVTLSTIADGQVTIEATYSRVGESATWIGQTYSIEWLERQPLVQQALESRQPVVGGHLDAAAAASEFQEHLGGVRHTATLPLLRGEAVHGLLVVSRLSDPAFTADELATLNLVGHAAMLSLHNARLHAEAIEARNQAQVLARSLQAGTDTALELVQELDLSDVASRLLARAIDIADADRAVLLTIDGDDAVVLRSLARGGGPQPIEPPERLRVAAQPLLVAALETAVAQQSHEISADNLGGPYQHEMDQLQTFASVPLKLGGEATGILNLSRYRKERFSDEQLRALTLLGQVAALAMRNARLFEELREASAAKTDFLNMAAHELRTPISVLRGYLSLLIDGTLGEAPASWRHPLDVLAAKARELNQIAEELLLAARVQSGSIGGKQETFELTDIVKAAIDGVQPAAGLAKGSVELRSAESGVVVQADRNQLRRVLDNLLVNAITYCAGPPEVAVTVRRRNGRAVVSVADNGRGIPPEKWEAIFDQFVRVDEPDEPLKPGTGLGLYVSRGLARANGGDVRLVSSVMGSPSGSEFEVELPLADAES